MLKVNLLKRVYIDVDKMAAAIDRSAGSPRVGENNALKT